VIQKTVRPIICESACCPARTVRRCSPRQPRRWVVTTLGTGEDDSTSIRCRGTYKEQFLLHYNFPPYSVGETGRLGGTKRREIGHGKLACARSTRCCRRIHEFPSPCRVVSEITESNRLVVDGLRCGASLALMDAGVPLKRPTAGIAMASSSKTAFCRAVRHLGDEESSRRHGLQRSPAPTRASPRCRWDIKIAAYEEILKVALGRPRKAGIHILVKWRRR